MLVLLVTGGAGFIGSNFVKLLLHNNSDFKIMESAKAYKVIVPEKVPEFILNIKRNQKLYLKS